MTDLTIKPHAGSFRDPDGYVVSRNGEFVRVITKAYAPHYEHLVSSGLYDMLAAAGLLIPHSEASFSLGESYKVLQPEQIPFISYPYEWSFNQLKDAALLTLEIQAKAIEHGMSLKDATAYNVQFRGASPVFIDTSSFELLDESRPWQAYGQFCRHFLAPLALMSYTDLRLSSLLTVNIDGIPLDLCVKLLPGKCRFNLGLLTHLYLHAKAIKKYEASHSQVKTPASFGARRLLHIIRHLKQTVEGLGSNKQKTEWDDYYLSNNNYTGSAFSSKKEWIQQQLEKRTSELRLLWDMGANDGTFSRLAAGLGISTVAMDIDSKAVDANYLRLKSEKQAGLLPLVIDLANPSPAIGWNTEERSSIYQRSRPDLIMSLALVHHLAIGLNLPLKKIAAFFAERSGRYLLIEFVGREDSQVEKLLVNRKDIFNEYNQEGFLQAFKTYFTIEDEFPIPESSRTLYLLKLKG